MTEGWCAVCGTHTRFRTGFMYTCSTRPDGGPMPNWREHMACVECGFSSRIRAAIHAFQGSFSPSPDARIYITEQTTPLYGWLRSRYPGTSGSEYFGDKVPFGSEYQGLRNEDMMATTWADAEFDHVLSFDVLEHVPDALAALRECGRILRPGGTLLWSAPFHFDPQWRICEDTIVRAELREDGEIVHLMEPEYHGNPVDPEGGALCYRYFGLDAIELMREAGFEDVRILLYWSPQFGYLGVEQVLCVARKPG